MKKLFLIRHGETDGNRALKYYGHTDIRLNRNGIEQVRKLAESIGNEPIVSIYSSDLARAYETATIIAKDHGLNVMQSRGLREINLGDWEGLTFEEIKARDEELVRQWIGEFSTFRMPNGESIPEFRTRIEDEVNAIIAQNSEGTVCVVTHGGVTRMVLCHIMGWDLASFWHIRQDTGCLNIIDFEGGRSRLVLLNNIRVGNG